MNRRLKMGRAGQTEHECEEPRLTCRNSCSKQDEELRGLGVWGIYRKRYIARAKERRELRNVANRRQIKPGDILFRQRERSGSRIS